jgi:hypothetical protein
MNGRWPWFSPASATSCIDFLGQGRLPSLSSQEPACDEAGWNRTWRNSAPKGPLQHTSHPRASDRRGRRISWRSFATPGRLRQVSNECVPALGTLRHGDWRIIAILGRLPQVRNDCVPALGRLRHGGWRIIATPGRLPRVRNDCVPAVGRLRHGDWRIIAIPGRLPQVRNDWVLRLRSLGWAAMETRDGFEWLGSSSMESMGTQVMTSRQATKRRLAAEAASW